jgi:hypothetical protein
LKNLRDTIREQLFFHLMHSARSGSADFSALALPPMRLTQSKTLQRRPRESPAAVALALNSARCTTVAQMGTMGGFSQKRFA